VTPFSQEHFGISPQDPMHNDCRSDAYTDQLSLSIDAEELTLGNTCASDSCQDQDQEAKSCQSRDQIEPFTSVPRTAKNASRPLHGGGRTGGQALGQQNDSLSHIRAELRVKIEELAAAEATVSKLRDEIKLLEASAKRQSHFEDTIKHKASHKRANDEILHGAKRLKERSTSLNLASGTSEGLNVNGEEAFNLTDLHFSTAKGPPRIITTAGERTHHSFHQNNISTSGAPEPCLARAVQNLGQSLPLISKDTFPLRVERSSIVQPLSKQTPVDESRERLSDAGPDFLERGLVNCRACSLEDLGQSVVWVASI
jgi:hypothetical protein